MEHADDALVMVFAGDFNQASEIQFLLESNDIESVIENERMGTIAPWVISAGGVNPVKVLVMRRHAEQAIALIATAGSDVE